MASYGKGDRALQASKLVTLQTIRLQRRLTQSQIARELKVSSATVCNWERSGVPEPRREYVARLLGKNPQDFDPRGTNFIPKTELDALKRLAATEDAPDDSPLHEEMTDDPASIETTIDDAPALDEEIASSPPLPSHNQTHQPLESRILYPDPNKIPLVSEESDEAQLDHYTKLVIKMVGKHISALLAIAPRGVAISPKTFSFPSGGVNITTWGNPMDWGEADRWRMFQAMRYIERLGKPLQQNERV